MNGLRKGNGMELVRTGVYGGIGNRYGVLRHLDVHVVRGGKVREVIIILIFLITAIIVWMPKKGGKK